MLYSPHLITHRIMPENQEFPMLSLSSRITPEHLFYRRNHFLYPNVDMRFWRLSIEGCVNKPLYFRYDNLLNMPQVTLPVTLECVGDKRSFFEPKTRGEQWGLGAISHAVWTGVRLQDLLHAADVQGNAREVTFEGMDKGARTDMPGVFSYKRSLSLERALHPDTIVALYMNGKPLPFRHGYPARLIVPGWYGMASVKWLHRIVVIEEPFQGPFQVVDYVFNRKPLTPFAPEPITTIRLNSTIAGPTDQEVLARGENWIWGIAISGSAPVVQVEISIDNGNSWLVASWMEQQEAYSWRRWCWKWTVTEPGTYDIKVRAKDAAGNTQSEMADWNVNGYGYNAIQHIRVYID
ncbi:sulfite oxidase [Paenibacillus alginolyticus]|uniref:Sulfite oxidase n=1 Tax=Paenibacillus alginolyticus TaxID=59839 RepID=A0ABT4GHF0_9BACL|nr:sulfite oxidase [Paenibacillus alginolyticus]MCY9695618.1 sulfite oxidase [Paenibacillus alginolyticus]